MQVEMSRRQPLKQSTTSRRDLTWSDKSGHPKYSDVGDTKEVDNTKQSKQTEWKDRTHTEEMSREREA